MYSEVKIGSEVCVEGTPGVVRGVERLEDDSVCGIILMSPKVMTPSGMIHIDLRNGAELRIRDEMICRGCGRCRQQRFYMN